MNRQGWVLIAVLGVLAGVCGAETYHLDAESGFQNVADSPEGEYLLAISKVKQQLLSGSSAEVIAALEQLKVDFPQLAGEEVDAFIAAEQFYADSVWHKAAVEYKKFVNSYPESLLYPVAMERYFSIGVAYLQGEKRRFIKILKLPAFDDGVNIIWDIADREGHSPLALRALTSLARAQEQKNKYFEAYQTWAEIATRWPTGETGKQALLRMAQELHASYSGAQYDAAVLESARSYYEDFTGRYPALAEELNIAGELALITEQLAYKQYELGFYYERTDKPDAAKMYYDKVLADWPGSKAADMVRIRRAPDAPPTYKATRVRKMFDVTNLFLDSWFGIEGLFDKVLPEDGDTSEMSPDILGEDVKQ